ncbi:hypothetical protein PM082_007264 [Marasmius tenuissimus]|nr:hypothetical protein PM082_007264 [Marasmius tenuissimus]
MFDMFLTASIPFFVLMSSLSLMTRGALLTREEASNLGIFNNSTLKNEVVIGTFDSDNIPRQCAGSGPCNDTPNCNNEELSCICTNDFAEQLAKCASCVVQQDKSVKIQDAQGFIDAFASGCSSGGFNIKSAKVTSGTITTRVGMGALAAGALVVSTALLL